MIPKWVRIVCARACVYSVWIFADVFRLFARSLVCRLFITFLRHLNQTNLIRNCTHFYCIIKQLSQHMFMCWYSKAMQKCMEDGEKKNGEKKAEWRKERKRMSSVWGGKHHVVLWFLNKNRQHCTMKKNVHKCVRTHTPILVPGEMRSRFTIASRKDSWSWKKVCAM